MSQDWSNLPSDILSSIFMKLPLDDYIRSRSVCSWWLSILGDLKQCRSKPGGPWLLRPPEVGDHEDIRWRFTDIFHNRVYTMHLPELQHSIVIGSGEGWLVVADEKTGDLRLFNPFTRNQIQLPPSTTFNGIVGVERDSQDQASQYFILDEDEPNVRKLEPLTFVRDYIANALLTSSGCGFTVVVFHRFGDSMSFARAGDKEWKTLRTPKPIPFHYRCTLFKDLFYFMDGEGWVFSLDLSSNALSSPPIQVPSRFKYINYSVVLPESGKLLLMKLFRGDITAVIIDGKSGEAVEARSLDGYSLFVTDKSDPTNLMCVLASDLPEVQRNSIYYMANDAVKVISMEVKGSRTYPLEKGSSKLGWEYVRHVWISPVIISLA